MQGNHTDFLSLVIDDLKAAIQQTEARVKVLEKPTKAAPAVLETKVSPVFNQPDITDFYLITFNWKKYLFAHFYNHISSTPSKEGELRGKTVYRSDIFYVR